MNVGVHAGYRNFIIAYNRYYEKIGKEVKDITDDLPFEIPDSWMWVKIKDIFNIQTGANFKKESTETNKELDPEYVRVYRGGNILPQRVVLKPDDLFIKRTMIPNTETLNRNDLITPAVTSIENIGKIARIEENQNFAVVGGFVYYFRPFLNNDSFSTLMMFFISSPYICESFRSITKKSGQAFYNMNKERLKEIYLPIPPLQEQCEIVKKIHVIDLPIGKYSLFEEELTILENNFPEKLKKSILQYAIQGKLVPQDPNDEPASVLLERIKAEKEKLIKEGKIKRDKNESVIYQGDDKNYYENLPRGWVVAKLSDIANYRKGPFGSSLTKGMFVSETTPGRVKVYEQKNAIQHNPSIGDYYITPDKFRTMLPFIVNPNDFIVSCAGTIGEIYKLPEDSEIGVINQALMRITLFDEKISPFFEIMFYQTLRELSNTAKGTAIKNIPPFEILKPHKIMLPPLREQQKIVNKIKQVNLLIEILYR